MGQAFFADGPLGGRILDIPDLVDILMIDMKTAKPGEPESIKVPDKAPEMFRPNACYIAKIRTKDGTMASYELANESEIVENRRD